MVSVDYPHSLLIMVRFTLVHLVHVSPGSHFSYHIIEIWFTKKYLIGNRDSTSVKAVIESNNRQFV